MNHESMATQTHGVETASLPTAALIGDAAPSRVLLSPWGRVESTRGDFVLDEESVRLAVEAFEAHGTDLPIDFEHQTLGGAFTSPTGQAPAAGWIKRLHGEPGTGLLADIEWTSQGRALVAGKQYRYLSPVAMVRKADRKLVAIHSAALTNKPAIVGMTPIVNGTRHEAVEARLEALRTELQLPDNSGVEEVLAAAGRRLFELEARRRGRDVADRVGEAVRAGKLVEAQRAWAEQLAARDEAAFAEWFRTAPVVVPRGDTFVARHGPAGDGRAAAARARAEYRANPLLRRLTTEEAYVTDELRMQKDE